MSDTPVPAARDLRADSALALLFALATGIILARDITVGGVRWKDESTHAMDGVLLLDWLQAGPTAWRDPLDFAVHQYAHYPNLGFMGAFPPGFAAVEWAFFAIFGVSIVTARLVSVFFGLATAVGCYALARQWCSRWTAAFATAFLVAMPITVEWGRQAMLEMPTLALVVWLLVFACRYFARPSWGRLIILAGFVFVAPLFKQNALFAVPVLGILAPYHWWRGRVPRRQFVGGVLLMIVPFLAYTAVALKLQGSGQIMDRVFNSGTPLSQWLGWQQLAWYFESVPRKAGYVVALLAAIGIVLAFRARDWRWTMIALSFGCAWALVTAMQHKETRYFYLGYLPIALWAGMAAATLLHLVPTRRLRAVLGTTGVLATLAAGYAQPIDYRPDFTPLVAAYAADMRDGLVLVEADRDTCFVLAARTVLGPRGCLVARGSKLLYSCSCNLDWDFASHVSSPADVTRLIDHYAFDLIFLERGNPNHLKEVTYLEQVLADGERFERVGTHELSVPPPYSADPITVDVFRPRQRLARQAREIEIPVPLARRTVRITLGSAQ